MQPVPKAAYRSDFRENTNFCPQRDSNLGPVAQQASMLPLDHCDLYSDVVQRSNVIRNSVLFLDWHQRTHEAKFADDPDAAKLSAEHRSALVQLPQRGVSSMPAYCAVIFLTEWRGRPSCNVLLVHYRCHPVADVDDRVMLVAAA